MTTRYTITLIAFVALYLTASLAPLFSVIGLNYLIEPSRCWTAGLSMGQEVAFWLFHVAWAWACLIYSGRATITRINKAVTA